MKKDEALKLIANAYPDHYVDKVTETEKYFLISIIPNSKQKTNRRNYISCDDGLKAVDKKTKQIFTYNPIRHGR